MSAARVAFSLLLACLLAVALTATPAAARKAKPFACVASKSAAKKSSKGKRARVHRKKVQRKKVRRAYSKRAHSKPAKRHAKTALVCKARKAPAKKRKPAPAPAPTTTPTTDTTSTSPTSTTSTTTTTAPSDPTAGGGRRLLLGINGNTQGYGDWAPSRQQLVAQSGVKWLREMFSWADVQPTSSSWSWSKYDTVMTGAAQNGLTILPVLMDTPSWAGANWASVPSDPAAYAAFAAKVAERYGEGGTFWKAHPELTPAPISWYEVMNEAYVDSFQPAAYARLVKATASAVRARQAGARFVISADLKGDWVDALFAAAPDLADSFDAVAIHPYAIDLSSTSSNPLSYGFPVTIDGVRSQLLAHGADKPLWLTELGFSTCPGGTAAFCVSETRQADLVKEAVAKLTTTYASSVGALFLYHYNDWGADDGDREHYFGLTRRDGSWKPAFHTLRQITGVE